MVRLVYTVSITLTLVACTAQQSYRQPIAVLQTRLERDVVREKVQSIVMRQVPYTRYDPDVTLMRTVMRYDKPNQAYIVDPGYVPKLQIYTNKAISLEDAVVSIARSLGYEPVFDAHVDTKQKVVIHNTRQSLQDITESLAYQSNTRILAFPDSKVLMVTERN